VKLLIDIDVSAQCAYVILTTKNYKNKCFLKNNFFIFYLFI